MSYHCQTSVAAKWSLGGDSSSLELIVTSYNINYGINQPLLDRCKYLNEYSTLVNKIKNGLSEGLNLGESMTKAVNFCINNDIMKDYLQEKGKEVFSMFRMEWNIDDAMEAWKEEAHDEGMAQGMAQGIEQGRTEGEIKNSEKVARKMLLKGMSFDIVQELTDLSLQRIEEIAKSMKN